MTIPKRQTDAVLRRVGLRHRSLHGRLVLAAGLLVAGSAAATTQQPYTLDWDDQFGVAGYDFGYTVVTDPAGNAFVSGLTKGALFGPSAGLDDAFFAKYDAAGNQVWAKQVGTTSFERADSIALDSAGNIYIAGYTSGSFGGPNAGSADAYVAKYDPSGNFIWSSQIGSSASERGNAIAVDQSGSVYLTGLTNGALGGAQQGLGDAFLAKFDATTGGLDWTRQFGTTGAEQAYSVAVDSAGNAFVAGYTAGALYQPSAGGLDAFVVKYTPAGNVAWSEQVGTSGTDFGFHVAVDGGGNAYLSGTTAGALDGANAGGDDAFVVKFDTLGNAEWATQLGSSDDDAAPAVEPSPDGTVFIAGRTDGDLAGPNAGGRDAFLAQLDSNGDLLWSQQVGTSSTDEFSSIALAGPGAVVVTGGSNGDLSGTQAGGGDVILQRYVVPEPGSSALLGIGALGLLRRRRIANHQA